MKYKAVFFDFDGTLMDTGEGIINSGIEAMKIVGIPIPQNPDYRRFIGPPLRECFRITFGVNDEDILTQLTTEYRKHYRKVGIFQSQFYPNMLEVLKELKAKGYKICVASMKTDDVIHLICDAFDLTKDLDFCGGMVDDINDTKAKIIQRGCKSLGLEEKDCVLVGDTIIDCEGAKTAGVDFIKVGWGFGYRPEDEGVINDAKEILKLV